jgi:UrcA family protein
MIRKLALVSLLAAPWIAAPGSVAGDVASSALVSSVTVRYDALELRSDDGIARLHQRLQQAARRSCDSLPGLDRWTATARHRCVGDTLEAAIRQVRDARLTAHHRACQRDATGRRCLGPREVWAGAPASQHRDSTPPPSPANL